MEIRPATEADLIELCGGPFDESVRAWSVYDEDELVAVGGLRYTWPTLCFSDIKLKFKEHPRDVVRLVRKVQELLEREDSPVVAIADEAHESAPGLLTHMGFVYHMTNEQGEVFVWQKPQFH